MTWVSERGYDPVGDVKQQDARRVVSTYVLRYRIFEGSDGWYAWTGTGGIQMRTRILDLEEIATYVDWDLAKKGARYISDWLHKTCSETGVVVEVCDETWQVIDAYAEPWLHFGKCHCEVCRAEHQGIIDLLDETEELLSENFDDPDDDDPYGFGAAGRNSGAN